MVDEHGEEWLTLEETLSFLSISKQTLYRLLERGDLRGSKVGRQRRFRKADLTAYLERGPVATALSTTPTDALDEGLDALAALLTPLGWTPEDEPAPVTSEEKTQRLVGRILALAITQGASDIHLQPAPDGLQVRIRIDGVLHLALTLPASVQAGILACVKGMANLNLDERNLPQDGRIRLRTPEGHEFDIRVNSTPSVLGECIVMRILNQQSVLIGLERLGIADDTMTRLQALMRKPTGLIIATGPTGSGKTTTLYSMLGSIHTPAKKTMTVEDPVEYLLSGLMQAQVNMRVGLTFASMLRAFLRQDPDVIMVGETRDRETAHIAMQAAITGHLVLTTLPTISAAAGLIRLVEMGIEPFLAAEATAGVVAQRLVRNLCPHCKEPVEMPVYAMSRLRALARVGGYTLPNDAVFHRAVGCDRCGYGYRGRSGLFEVLIVTSPVKEALLAGASLEELTAVAVKEGMVTLVADGLRKAADGLTTVEEVLRVMGVE
jgi:excisionase family DNA binding protein